MSDDEFEQASTSKDQPPQNVKDKLSLPTTPRMRSNSGDRMAGLRRQRGTVKQRLTLFEKYCSKYGDNALNNVEKSELKLRIQAVESLFQTFNTLQSEIENNVDESDLSVHLEYRDMFEEQYFKLMAAAKCMLVDESSESSPRCMNSHKSVSVKLPEIKLPSFSGSYDQWLEFRNSYETMIHKRDDLDPIQKFHYLRSSLGGSALQVISALEFTTANYAHAWDLLVQRFHNNRLLIHNHVKSLFTIPSISQDSPTHLRKLIDTIYRNLRALKTIGEPTDSWDTLVIYLVVTKLDSATEREWENHKGSLTTRKDESLKLDDLLSFLKNRADMLEMISASHKSSHSAKSQHESKSTNNDHPKRGSIVKQQVHSYVATQNKPAPPPPPPARICPMCEKNHALYTCILFLNLPVRERVQFVEKKSLCPNCLRLGHSISDCTFGTCRQCQQKHNGLLHHTSSENVSIAARAHHSQPADNGIPSVSAALHSQSDLNSRENRCDNSLQAMSRGLQPVLLSTALIEIADANNRYHCAKAILDSGSQHSFITVKLCRDLEIPMIQSTIRVSGVGQSVTSSSQLCDITLRSKSREFNTQVQCLVLPCITSRLPSVAIDFDQFCIPENITLADPTFNIPSDIDVLIGADLFWDLLDGEKMRLACGPYLQRSKLGWLISGSITKGTVSYKTQCNFTQTCDSIDMQMQRFWELEDIPKPKSAFSAEEKKCEEIFISTTKREQDGRFNVRIPLKESANSLGDSYKAAETRFKSLERKFDRSPQFKQLYSDFIHEYIDLGHMTPIEKYEEPCYFLPHHGVFKGSKIRTVFDASCKTTSNKSLNDIQFTGPILQNDIFSILLRFRQYRDVACADVEKMFRQILVQSDQRNLQLILWRDNPCDLLGIYRLNTVTYGTSSAPFLSIRCLKELARCCEDPEVSKIIDEDFYVDDLITGSDDEQALFSICERISQVLRAGCFPLRKWTFNHDVTKHESKELSIGEHQNKTLGLGWFHDTDELHFTTKIEPTPTLTKRAMLSVISQIYDPLGLLGPAVIIAKIVLQKLWLCKLEWDEPVPDDVIGTWKVFTDSLDSLRDLRIPRFVRGLHTQHTELHIFSDSSQDAFGACAYLRTYDDESPVTVKLLCAKVKVTPLKAVSIPRLELCGALVGARLYHKIMESLRLKIDRVCFWTDSTIVIGWLRMAPRLLKQFVQNRVTTINELTGDSAWRHVSGKENPADLLSRGLNLRALSQSHLWLHGPSFLQDKEFTLPNIPSCEPNELPELKSEMQTAAFVCSENAADNLFDFSRYSSFSRLKRIVAYMFRFLLNARSHLRARRTGLISVDELRAAECTLIRVAQKQMFPKEYYNLANNLPILDKRNS